MERIPEAAELMLGLEQAQAYAGTDLSQLNAKIIEAFRMHFAEFSSGEVLDLGCGTADVTIRFAQAYPQATLVGIDGASSMLEMGKARILEAGLEKRIELRKGHLPNAELGHGRFDALVANSLLHHLDDPAGLWRTVKRCVRAGAPVMVVDLIRPHDPDAARLLVEKYAERAHPQVKQDFFHSLCAAYTVQDLRRQLDAVGFPGMRVEAVDELQMKIWGRNH